MDPHTRESRGFGFVSMSNVKKVDRCIKYLDGSVLEGRVIMVEKAKRRRGRTPTHGRYLGLRTVVVDPEATLLIQGVVLLVTHLRETRVVVDPEATCLLQGFVLLVTHLREARVGAGHTLRIIVAILSRIRNTGVKPEILKNVRKAIATLPETFKPHKAVKKVRAYKGSAGNDKETGIGPRRWASDECVRVGYVCRCAVGPIEVRIAKD
ncbi:serine/arginine-rich splicing factor SR45A-like protein isoform X1 [Tanacetum coccineum]